MSLVKNAERLVHDQMHGLRRIFQFFEEIFLTISFLYYHYREIVKMESDTDVVVLLFLEHCYDNLLTKSDSRQERVNIFF